MSAMPEEDRRRFADREAWPWWKRLGSGAHKVCIQPWLDAQGNGSIPAVLSGLLGLAISYRLVSFPSVGWPEAWIVFSCFVGVAVYEAAMTVARLNPERLLELAASRMGVGDVGHAPAANAPHQWAAGEPDEGVM